MTYEQFDAPPPTDDDVRFRTGLPAPSDYVLKLANAIDRLAAVLERQSSPGVPQMPVQSPPPGTPTGPPAGLPGGNETQIKRGKKIFAICKQNDWDIPDIGQRVTGHAVNPNSQKWAEPDQIAVLDAFKEWGVGVKFRIALILTAAALIYWATADTESFLLVFLITFAWLVLVLGIALVIGGASRPTPSPDDAEWQEFIDALDRLRGEQ